MGDQKCFYARLSLTRHRTLPLSNTLVSCSPSPPRLLPSPPRPAPPRPPQHYRKNQYEEALFRAEDDHFELDMIIDQNSSAIAALHPLAAALEGMGEEERGAWQLPDRALRAFHFRAVQRIYGEQGAQVVALLRQNPAVAVPTVLNRLTQKDAEWRQVGAAVATVVGWAWGG